jgi:hypothetical protein
LESSAWGSFFLGLSEFNDEGSASEFFAVLGNSLSSSILGGESNKAGSLESAETISEQVNVFYCSAISEKLLNFVLGSGEGKTFNENFKTGALDKLLWGAWLIVDLGFLLILGHCGN